MISDVPVKKVENPSLKTVLYVHDPNDFSTTRIKDLDKVNLAMVVGF